MTTVPPDSQPPPVVEVVSARFDVLDALADDAMQVRDLADELDGSRSTVSRALRDLEDVDLVERADGGYRATLVGRLALSRTRDYYGEMSALAELTAALAPLPPDAPLPPEAVPGGEAFLGTPPDPYRPNEAAIGLYERAERCRSAIGMVTDDRLLAVGHERVTAGDLVITDIVRPELLAFYRREAPDRFAEMRAAAGYDCRVCPDLPPFGLVLAETGDRTELLVGVGRRDGGLHAVILNDDPAAVEWAEAFYEDLRARSRPVEEWEA